MLGAPHQGDVPSDWLGFCWSTRPGLFSRRAAPEPRPASWTGPPLTLVVARWRGECLSSWRWRTIPAASTTMTAAAMRRGIRRPGPRRAPSLMTSFITSPACPFGPPASAGPAARIRRSVLIRHRHLAEEGPVVLRDRYVDDAGRPGQVWRQGAPSLLEVLGLHVGPAGVSVAEGLD